MDRFINWILDNEFYSNNDYTSDDFKVVGYGQGDGCGEGNDSESGFGRGKNDYSDDESDFGYGFVDGKSCGEGDNTCFMINQMFFK